MCEISSFLLLCYAYKIETEITKQKCKLKHLRQKQKNIKLIDDGDQQHCFSVYLFLHFWYFVALLRRWLRSLITDPNRAGTKHKKQKIKWMMNE